MSKIDEYRTLLRTRPDWDQLLLDLSGLPGPRGNLELAQAVADEGNRQLFYRYLDFTPEKAPTGTQEEYLAFCGVLGLGTLLPGEGETDLKTLRPFASDPRWRVREAVAMALQRWGARDMPALLAALEDWSHGNPFEQRAVAAALCEPALLRDSSVAEQTLRLLDSITAGLAASTDRKSEATRVLRQGLAYCWSVAVAALPSTGRPLMEKWAGVDDPDVRWLLKQNLAKKRLIRIDPAWVEEMKARLQ